MLFCAAVTFIVALFEAKLTGVSCLRLCPKLPLLIYVKNTFLLLKMLLVSPTGHLSRKLVSEFINGAMLSYLEWTGAPCETQRQPPHQEADFCSPCWNRHYRRHIFHGGRERNIHTLMQIVAFSK